MKPRRRTLSAIVLKIPRLATLLNSYIVRGLQNLGALDDKLPIYDVDDVSNGHDLVRCHGGGSVALKVFQVRTLL
jgi:hypothetical protein